MTQTTSSLLRSVGGLAAVLCCLPAFAQDDPSPYYFGVNQAVTGDWNVFRSPDSQPASRDIISSTGLLAGIDQPFGRMRLNASAAVNANRFKNNKQLNNTDHNTRLQLDWASVERLSGDVVAYDRRSLNRYDLSTPEGTQQSKDLLHVTGAAVRARVGVVTLLTLDGGYSYERASHSLESLSNRDVQQGAAHVGLSVAPSDLWSARIGVRRTDGEYPNFLGAGGVRQADEFNRDDVDLSMTWVPTSNSKFDGRISSTREEHSVQGQRDRRYVTGLVGYDWTLTGKTRLRMHYSRDSSAGRSDTDLGLLTESSDTQVRDSVGLRAFWDATSKISVNAGVNHSRRKLDNAFTLSDGTTSTTDARTARDRLTAISLGVNYKPLRGLAVGCRVMHEERSVQGDDVSTTYPFDATAATCNLQWTLR
ncbi:hypothetical protein [Rhizobacter sp. LjRoot28]|uniref:hypothetical protein n=1 Tax=Rhizobacter sp. LjRoot28 TaxID=3342309 RepID=UPI003ED12AFA